MKKVISVAALVIAGALIAGALMVGCDKYRDNAGTSGGNPPSSREADRAQAASDIKGPVANTSSHTAGSRHMTDDEGAQNYNANNPYAAQVNGSNQNASTPNGVGQQSASGVVTSGNGIPGGAKSASATTQPASAGARQQPR